MVPGSYGYPNLARPVAPRLAPARPPIQIVQATPPAAAQTNWETSGLMRDGVAGGIGNVFGEVAKRTYDSKFKKPPGSAIRMAALAVPGTIAVHKLAHAAPKLAAVEAGTIASGAVTAGEGAAAGGETVAAIEGTTILEELIPLLMFIP